MPARTLKWLAIAVGALLVLAAVCGLLLRLLFDPNDYRSQIELAFKERTGRTLELEGKLGLKVLPRLAVSTGRFSISDRPGAGTGDFLTAQDARIGLALLPLLQRRLEFGVLTLAEPSLTLRVDAQGRDNWSDLLERPASPDTLDGVEPPTAAPDESGLDLRIAGLAIDEGKLTLDDDRDRRQWQVAGLTLDTGPLDFAEPTAVRTAFSLVDGDAVRLRALINGRVSQPRPRVWTLHDLDAELELPAGTAGRTQPVAGRIAIAHLTADLEARRYDAPGLRYRLGEARGEANLEARHTAQGLTVHGPVTLQRTDLRALLADLGIRLAPMREKDAPGDIEFSASLRYGPGLELREVVSVVGDTRLTGSMALGPGSPASLRFDLRGDRLNADGWLPAPPAAGSPTSAPGADTAATGRGRGRDVMGRLAFGNLTVAGIQLRDFEGRMSLRDGVLEADPLQASLFGGSGNARLRYELAATDPKLTMQTRLVNVDAAALLKHFSRQSRLSGRGTLSAQLTGTGRDRQALLASLAGPFEARIVDGRVTGIDLWAEIERAVAAARGAVAPRGSGNGHTPFDLIDARGQLAGKRIKADQFVVANASIRAQGKGTVDYGSGALDLALTARLLEAPQGEVAGIPLDRVVGVDVPLTVGGTLAEPRVRPDVGRLLESAAKQHLKQEGEQLEKKLKDKLNETLKDLFGQ